MGRPLVKSRVFLERVLKRREFEEHEQLKNSRLFKNSSKKTHLYNLKRRVFLPMGAPL